MPLTTPLTEEQLAAWTREHRCEGPVGFDPPQPGELCRACHVPWPCPVVSLVAEVRRLRREVDKWEKWNMGWGEQ